MLLNNIVVVNIKDINKMVWDMDLEHFIINKVENIVVNGVKIKCKVEVHYIILMDN